MYSAGTLSDSTWKSRPGFNLLRKAVTPLLASILAAGSIFSAAQTSPPEADLKRLDGKHEPAAQLILKGVPQFGQVTPTLYRGGQPSQEGLANLNKLGINIVVDLRGSRAAERELVTGLGMTYVALPWHCYNPRDENMAEFLKLLRKNPDKKVFVHCRLGQDRTGMEIAAYRMAEQNWTAEEAWSEMEAFGVTWFHRTTCPRLEPYERDFPKRFQSSPAFEGLRPAKDAVTPKH